MRSGVQPVSAHALTSFMRAAAFSWLQRLSGHSELNICSELHATAVEFTGLSFCFLLAT